MSDEFVRLSAERRAAAIAAAHHAAAQFGGVEVRELPDDAPLAPSAELWSTGDDAKHLVLISANAVATSLLLGERRELVQLDDADHRDPEATLAPVAGLPHALTRAVEFAIAGVPRSRAAREDVMVMAEEPLQESEIAAVHRAAFRGPDEARLVDALRQTDAWIPPLSFVAREDSGDLVGHVLLSNAHVGATPVLALAPVGVAPGRQRHGIGERLVIAALLQAAALGHDTVVVLGDPAYYGRFGFMPARALGIVPPDETWPDAAFQARSLTGAPNPQGRMAYAAPFGV